MAEWMWKFAILVAITSGSAGFAQSTNSGDIRGTVTDPSGATVAGATVTVLDVDKGVSSTYVTNGAGLYDTNSVVPDHYTVTFTKDGFQTLVRGPITVDVGITPVNGELSVGGVEQKIVVSTDVPLLRTETSEQSTTLEAKTMAELPNVGQDWEVFVKQLPGAQNAPGQSTGLFNNAQAGQVTSANGNLPFSNILADGASTTLPASANSDISTFEVVQELQVSTSTFSAQYGVGGIIYNQISKSGTDRFHGTLYDYFQNSGLNAATWAPNGGTRHQNLAQLRYNNYGGSVGGPILPKKLFFYFNYDKLLQNGTANQGVATVPTSAMLAGDFTGQPIIYDPATTKVVGGVITRQSFADEYGNGNRIPAARLDPVAKAIQAYYPTPCAGCGTTVNGQTSNNYSYNSPNPKGFAKYFGRLDYDVRQNNRLTASVAERDTVTQNTAFGICPITCYTLDVNGYNAQVSDVWTVSPTFINELRLAYTAQLNFFQPQTLGLGYPAKLGWQFAKADVFPDIQFQGSAANVLEVRAGTIQTLKINLFDPSDVVTMIRGKHILHFGGEFEFSEINETAFNNINGGTMSYTGVYTNCPGCAATTGTGGLAYADFLLGQTRGWSASVTPEYGARIKIPQMFVQDDYKLRPNLTLNLGLRYQIQRGWNEIRGNMAVFDPSVTNPVTGTPGAYWYGTTKANGRTTLQAPVYSTLLPRIGFAYGPNPKMTIRGGWGIYAYLWNQDDYGNGLGGEFGSKGSITDSTGYNPVTTLSSDGSTLPYIAATTNPAAFNGQNVNGNLYNAPVPKIYQWNLAVQQQVTSSLVAEIAYVASHGFNLQFPIDINQVPETKLGQGASAKPYPQYGQIVNTIDNATSNYNSLQTSIQQRLTNGLSLNLNYVWSHFLDVQDSSGWGGRSGGQIYQRANNPAANYASSNFDVRNAFKGTVLYQLPFGRGRQFLNRNAFLDALVGGWQLSSTFVVQSGNPFTPTLGNNHDVSGSLSTGSSGYAFFPNVIGNPYPAVRTRKNWYNACTIISPGVVTGPAGCIPAFAVPSANTFGNSRRNSLINPKSTNTNISLGKTFGIIEAVKFQLRIDAQNAFNHPIVVVGSAAGVDSGTSNLTNVQDPGRSMQIGGKIIF